MFCPECGKEEIHGAQFCRGCGIDLRRIRTAVDSPDSITASAMSARDEIGRAVAAKIRETQDAHELKKVAEDVLPEIEKFLESPAEKRLRRIRLGTILASIGLGAGLMMMMVALAAKDEGFLFLAGFGLITFFLGLGFVVNGLFFTAPKGARSHTNPAETPHAIAGNTNDLRLHEPPASSYTSVTEHTTHHLSEKR